MGGFWLTGPTRVFSNEHTNTERCFCTGYHAKIDRALEDRLAARCPPVLNPAEVPGSTGHHLGSPLTYTITLRDLNAEAADAHRQAQLETTRRAEQLASEEAARKQMKWGDGSLIFPA